MSAGLPSAFAPQQDAALKAIADWRRSGGAQVFRLFGYAGTGKTTLARRIADDVEGSVVFGAFTGKAASVMRQKGCADAATIHSLIYRTKETEEGGPAFSLNRAGPAAKADLIVIDECSMVDSDLGHDLLSFDKPVLVLGDPAQLPPVRGGGFFTEGTPPDVMLTEVHRQAAGNPIVRLSMLVREGGRLQPGLTHGLGDGFQRARRHALPRRGAPLHGRGRGLRAPPRRDEGSAGSRHCTTA